MADPTQDIVAPTDEEQSPPIPLPPSLPGRALPPGFTYEEGEQMQPSDYLGPPAAPVAPPMVRPQALPVTPRPPPPPPGTARTWSITGGVASPVTEFTAGPRPPTDPRQELFRRQAASNAQLWRNLQSKTANLPMAQTEEAVAAAMRFQGIRQYQRDLAAGIPQAEAFARAAPMMFNAPKQSTLGQAANFLDVLKPAQKYHDVGGVLYREKPDGSVEAVTGPAAPKFHSAGGVMYREGAGGSLTAVTQPKPEAPSRFDTEEYSSLLRQIADEEKAMRDMPMGTRRADAARRVMSLQKQADAIRTRSQAPTTRSTGKRIRVRHPDGKFGSIPESQLEAAKAKGYTLVQ